MWSALQTIKNRVPSLSLAVLFLGTQVLFPVLASESALAAIVPTNKTGFASFPFNLSSAYTEPGGQPTATGSFTNGNVGPYVEGACIPSIIEVKNNSNAVGDIPVSPVYDFLNDDTAIDSLEMVGDSATAGNALNNPRAVADNLNDYTYPGTSLSGVSSFFSSAGSVSVTSSGPFGGNNAGTAAISGGDTFRHYNLVLQDVDPNETVYVAFCARLGLDASEYNGSSLSIRTAQGGQENIPIPVNALLRRPALTISKVVVGGSAQPSDFTFNVSPAVNGMTQVNIPAGQNSVTIDNIFPDGTFTITENSVPGYTFTSGTGSNCTFSGSTATATLVAAKSPTNATCQFTNSQLPGKIIVVKQTLPDADPQSFNFTSSYDTDGFSLSDGQQNDSGNIPAGNYSVAETVPAGWDLTSAVCSDGSPVSAIVLGGGETVTCTFTNTKRGNLIVQKTTAPAGDLTSFLINASGTGTIFGGSGGSITDAIDKNYEVTPGTYSVTETVPNGWSKTGDTCQGVVVSPGATVYCTITNTKLAKLKIVKDAVPNGPQDFAFTTSNNLTGFILDDDVTSVTPLSEVQFNDLSPNQEFSVTEGALTGWDLTSALCNKARTLVGTTLSVTLLPGEDITCTFTNTQRGSISGVKFNDLNGNGIFDQGELVLSNWNIFIDTNNNGIIDNGEVNMLTDNAGLYTFSNLVPSNYILAEVLLNGWTQTLAPPVVQLAAGQTSTGNNFGNFQNGSVSGLKFNDRNGDGARGQGEETLTGWTMNLFNDGNDADSLLDDLVATTQTDANGNYSFPNLTLGTYQVCEVQQTGWVQTVPANNGCHLIIIDQSGETNPSKDFGNQGRGSIQVLKNVDTNGDGQVDITGATDWTWDIAGGAQNTATGSSQNVAAGSYTVSEDQQANYHVTSVSCTGEQGPLVSEQIGVTVSPGENVVCTFVNTRNTGTITVNKVVNPTNDTGKFNLQVDSNTAGTGANVGHGGTTGSVSVVTGQHTIGETAGTDTTLNNYSTSFSCVNQNQQVVASGNTASSTAFAVNYQDNIVCTITNTRLGTIIVQKQTNPDGDPAVFNFTASYDNDGFSLSDGQSNNSGNLLPATYTVAETVPAGWDLESATCTDQSSPASIQLGAGETVTCTFTNEKDANIIITKQTDPDGDPQTFSFNTSYDNDGFSLSDGQSNDSGDLDPGTYSVSENVPAGWDLDSATCSDRSTVSEINLSAGETVTCTFTNEKDANIVVIKQTDPDGSQEVFNFTASYDGDGFGLSDGQSNDSGDLDPGTYSVGEIVPSEWDLVNTTCSDGSASSAINLAAGETVTCTFTNRQDGHIIIQKETDPNGDPTAFNFTASYDGDGFGLSDGQSNDSGNLNPGIYSVSESLPEGWYLDSVTCDDGSLPLAIDLAAGETVTCTFNNVKFASIQISKDTITTNENNQGQDFQFTTTGTGLNNFSLDDDTDPTLENIKTFNNLVAGTYSITEGATAGWDMTGLICFGIDGARRNITDSTATLTLQPGENAVCAYTNTERGSVTIIKDAQPDSIQAFKFTGSLGDPDEEEGPNFTLVDDGTNDTTDRRLFTNLENGTYTVTEPNVKGWTLESINCNTEEGVNVNNRNVVIGLEPGEDVTCTFVNTRDTANITVTKQTVPEGSEEDFTIRLRDTAEEPAVVQESILSDNESDSYTVVTGEYNLAEELIPEGWDLTDAVCTRGGDEEESGPVFDPRSGSFEASKDEDIDCVFTNTQRGNVVVTKYNDRNQDRSRDGNEEALAGWDMTLSDGQEEGFSATQATGPDGTTSFNNVVGGSYALSEDLESQAGWNFSGIECDDPQRGDEVEVQLVPENGHSLFVNPGATVNCSVGNFPDAALNITKTNNRPAPTVVGDTVTYTLTVSVPNDSGAVFGTTVQDLPPENFDYVAGSWTATSSVRGDIKADGITTEPTYGSPGAWKLGEMLPGEVVTLTYRALIANSVISGSYPDIAFTQGCNTRDPTCTAIGSAPVLGNVSTGANSPFVRTAVAITTPQVLGANTTVLVETGQRLQQAIVTTISLILLGLSALVVYRRKEGGRS